MKTSGNMSDLKNQMLARILVSLSLSGAEKTQPFHFDETRSRQINHCENTIYSVMYGVERRSAYYGRSLSPQRNALKLILVISTSEFVCI